MTHYYEVNMTEQKKDFTKRLQNVLAPLMYEQLKNLYTKASIHDAEMLPLRKKKDRTSKSQVLKIFQKFLGNLPNLNNEKIERETSRIRSSSNIAEYFDDLIRAVIKSHILVYTWNKSSKASAIVKNRYHENVDINDFIHKCYVHAAKIFYIRPRLFDPSYPSLIVQENRCKCYELINDAITNAIQETLPNKLIYEEFQKYDYINDKDKEQHDLESIKKFLRERNPNMNLDHSEAVYDDTTDANRSSVGSETGSGSGTGTDSGSRTGRNSAYSTGGAVNGFNEDSEDDEDEDDGDNDSDDDHELDEDKLKELVVQDEDKLKELVVQDEDKLKELVVQDEGTKINIKDAIKNHETIKNEPVVPRKKEVIIDFGGRKTAENRIFANMIQESKK